MGHVRNDRRTDVFKARVLVFNTASTTLTATFVADNTTDALNSVPMSNVRLPPGRWCRRRDRGRADDTTDIELDNRLCGDSALPGTPHRGLTERTRVHKVDRTERPD